MVAFVALPAFLILLTLVFLPFRIVPVDVWQPSVANDAGGSVDEGVAPAQQAPPSPPVDMREGDSSGASRTSPCEPKDHVLETARRAAGTDYRHEVDPRMEVEGDTCTIVLWRLPKTPGGYRVVTVDADGDVTSIRPGL
jgi:hypothetical protein